MTAPIGPVEFLLLGFDGNQFTGAIASAITDLVDRGLVRLLDLAVVMKDASGDATILEMQELPDDVADALRALTGDVRGLMSEADLMDIATSLEPSSTVAALLVEHVWSMRFADAVRAAGGELLLSERIPGAVVDQARETLRAVAEIA